MPDITLKTTDGEIHGLKSIQAYINLFPDFSGHAIIDGYDAGKVDYDTILKVINLGLNKIRNTLNGVSTGEASTDED